MTQKPRSAAGRLPARQVRRVALALFAAILLATVAAAASTHRGVSLPPPAISRLASASLSGTLGPIVRFVNASAPSAYASSGQGSHVQHVAPGPPIDHRLMLTPQQWKADQSGPTLDQMFPPNSFGMQHPIVTWLLVLELLGLLAFPFSFLLFANLVDRGFVIAKTLGLLIAGYGVWIAVSLNLATFDRGLILVALLLFAAASVAVALKLRSELVAFVRAHWSRMLVAELVFLAGFALFIWLRMWYPDLGHQFSPVAAGNAGSGRMGEKQMELAFLNAIVRSRVFPPLDPFFAHGYINYYYYGFFLVGTLCKLTQIVPSTGFNLAIATFFAMLVGNVASTVLNLTRRVGPALVAAVFVGVIGNLNGGWQVIRGLMQIATVHLSTPLIGGILDVLSGAERAIFARQPMPAFDFWEPTRIVPGGDISEFPYFTYLFADLHPHLMAYPMTVAALALAVSLLLGTYPRTWRLAGTILLAGILVGAIAVTNPWDYPTYLAVIGLGALVGAYVRRRRFDFRDLARPIVWVAALVVLSFILYLPFQRSYQTVFATGVSLVRDITPEMLQSNGACPEGVKICPGAVRDILLTPLRVYLEHFGLFLFAVLSYLILLLLNETGLRERTRGWTTALRVALYYRDRLPRLWRAWRVVRRLRPPAEPVVDGSLLAGALVLVVGLTVLQYYLLAFLIAVFALTILLLLRVGNRLPETQLFVMALILVPLLISIATQIFFIKDWLALGISFRMNTIFKFYNQAWVLYAVASAASLYYFMAREIPDETEATSQLPDAPSGWRSPSRAARHGRHLATDSLWHSRFGDEGSEPWQEPGWSGALVPASAGSAARFAMVTRVDGVVPPEFQANIDAEGAGAPSAASPGVWHSVQHWLQRPLARPLTLLDRRPIWGTCFLLLLVASFVYTYAGTQARETYRTAWLPENSVPFTLDGMAFMKVAYPADYAGISWLNAHVRGAPVIVEDNGGDYDWRSRVSMFTGLPSVTNGIHEGEQRYADELNRGPDVQTLYDSTSIADAQSIIREYGIRYIYVGFSERQNYSPAGLAKFNAMVGHGLAVAFRYRDVTIYRVTRP